MGDSLLYKVRSGKPVKFFDFLKKLKEKKGYDAIELQVNAKNQAAYNMYINYVFND